MLLYFRTDFTPCTSTRCSFLSLYVFLVRIVLAGRMSNRYSKVIIALPPLGNSCRPRTVPNGAGTVNRPGARSSELALLLEAPEGLRASDSGKTASTTGSPSRPGRASHPGELRVLPMVSVHGQLVPERCARGRSADRAVVAPQ